MDLSFLSIILEASLPVQAVMLILFLGSLFSWGIIFKKRMMFTRVARDADHFENLFWSGKDLNNIYAAISQRAHKAAGLERIFYAGYGEFAKHNQHESQFKAHSDTALKSIQRAMRISSSRECEILESYLPFLATVGSASPYIGLFGTVWGIMTSFQALGKVEQATIAMVAPGISEALIATAMGLFAAIPAVIAYNRFVHDSERLYTRYDLFTEEFTIILHHQIHK